MNLYNKDLLGIKNLLTNQYSDIETAKKQIKPIFLKMNNPTFYKKHIHSTAVEKQGFSSSNFNKNMLVKFTSDCIKIINESQDLNEMLNKLQVEYSWTVRSPLVPMLLKEA